MFFYLENMTLQLLKSNEGKPQIIRNDLNWNEFNQIYVFYF